MADLLYARGLASGYCVQVYLNVSLEDMERSFVSQP